ncbi:VWA domain-containing protein [Jannaschia sp. KMU-145]|uniref:VWA domain-containing protein n=1 Tax=Jannaschia halovivens TaxID=3388667 RepID=UPI00396B3DAB
MTAARWASAVRAARCFAADPVGLGGLHLRARASDARDTWLSVFNEDAPVAARLHPDMSDEALFGGLDLAATLKAGRPVRRGGVLDRHDLAVLTMAERAPRGLAARLGQALDGRRVGLLALDEGVEDEALAPALSDRMAMRVDLDGLRPADRPAPTPLDPSDPIATDLARARLAATAAALGIASVRPVIQALRVAEASAALDGRGLAEADLTFAIAVSLLPRATTLPAPPPEPDLPEDAPDPAEAPPPDPSTLPADAELTVEAALALLPPDLLARIAAGLTPRASGIGAGAVRRGNRRGRPLPSRPGRLDGQARIDLVATLRAAAPWQRMRGGGPGQPVAVRASDIHLRRYETRSDRLIVFAVDASGSSALGRLAEAKGAVELLLAEAYARRDHVALIAFRGDAAQLLLPPTRSLVRTKRELAALPGGGGTPLAAGLRDGLTLAHQARGRGMDPALVVLTDGRPNIALSGEAARTEALADAEAMAGAIRAQRLPAVVIDTGTRPTPALADLAARMGAACRPLPRADAHGLSRIVADTV